MTDDSIKRGRLARLFVYFRRYARWFGLGTVFLVFTNLFSLWIPRQIGRSVSVLTDAMESGGAVDVSRIQFFAITIVLLALGACVARILSRVFIFYAGRIIEFDVRNELFDKLTELDAEWFQSQSIGDLTSRIINDVNNVRVMYGFSALNLVNTVVTYAAVLSFMFAVSPTMTWLSLAPYPFIILLMTLFTRALYTRTQASQEQLSVISAQAQEALAGAQVVRSFAIEDEMNERFEAASNEYVERNVSLAMVRGLLFPFVASIGSIGGLIILWFGGRTVIEGGISIGEFVEFSGYITALAWPTAGLGWSLSVWQRGVASFDRLHVIMGTEPAIQVEGKEAHASTLPVAREVFSEDIVFEDVSVEWPEGGKGLDHISTVIPGGGFTAIVGRTGAGKSTLVKLLTRLQDPTSGDIRIGGACIRCFPLQELRMAMGFVPQDALLFSRSVRDNIELGRLARDEHGEGWQSSVALEDAIRIANLEETVAGFEDGLDTMVGERGVTLSGGQRQRVTIARAVLLDPQILILDDALASVDTRTEHEILQELSTIMRGRTTILVTHRFNALAMADKIIVLDEGRIAEEGTHASLLEQQGVYARMFERQQLEAELEQ